MLPNRMQLGRQTEDHLKRLKMQTGITPNVSARIAFFRSIESSFIYGGETIKLDGSLVLDKVTWLGDTVSVTELVLKIKYPTFESRDLMKAWAAHVEDGIAALRNHKNLLSFSEAL
jgi:DNA sulfur modification protein DndE